MQQIQFVREGMNSYMVTSSQAELKRTSYEDMVLELTNVPNFMNYEVREMDGVQVLYYTLKYRTSLRQVLGDLKLTMDKIRNMILSIVEVLKQTEEYLLNQDYIMWRSDCTFVEIHTGNLVFTYCPGSEGGSDSLRTFLMELIQYIDKGDQDTYMFLMGFYNLVTNPDCSLDELSGYVEKYVEKPQGFMESNKLSYAMGDVADKERIVECNLNEKEKEEQKEKEKDISSENKGVVIVLILTVVNLLEVFLLLFEIWTYQYIWVLIISIILLLVSVIVHFQTEKNDNPDTIMEEYLMYIENEPADRKNDITNWELRTEKDIDEQMETTILMEKDDRKEIVVVDKPKEFYLRAVKPEKYKNILIDRKSVVVGSMESGCDYLIKEKGISRMHAKIMRKEDGLYIMDLNSTNGSYLNDEIMECGKEYLLRKDDVVSFAYIAVFLVDEREI